MKLIDKNISWIVVLAIGFLGTFDLLQGTVRILWGEKNLFFNLVRFVLIFLLLSYQGKYYGFKINYRPLYIFFALYSIVILLDLTIFSVNSIRDLRTLYPLSTFSLKTIQIFVLMHCSETIVSNFSFSKFVLSSFLFTILPAIFYIQFVGVEYLQILKLSSDDPNNIGVLALGYKSANVFVLCFITLFKGFRFHAFLEYFYIIVGCTAIYIMIISGERGPIIWGLLSLFICAAIRSKHMTKIFAYGFILCFILYINIDSIIYQLNEFAPRTAERLYLTVYEGYTANRFDFNQSEGSLYTDAFKQFMSSPFYGSYFRLLPSYSSFIGSWPHNIFLEFMITMGLMGLIPFCFFLRRIIIGLRGVFLRDCDISLMAIFALFISSFLGLLTSGSLVLNIEFWLYFYCLSIISSDSNSIFCKKRNLTN